MNFSTDRDLLLIEPNVFSEVSFAGQQPVSVTDGVLSGLILASAAADFEAAGVDAGSVVLIADAPFEVVDRQSANVLTVSLPRAHTSDPPIPGTDGTSLAVVARTFAQQAAIVHDLLLRMVGIDTDDPDGLDEDAIISLNLMAHLEALGTLERVYSAAQLLEGDNDHVRAKAQEYRERFAAARQRATVLVDVNGDGMAEERRRLGMIRLQRS